MIEFVKKLSDTELLGLVAITGEMSEEENLNDLDCITDVRDYIRGKNFPNDILECGKQVTSLFDNLFNEALKEAEFRELIRFNYHWGADYEM